MSSNVLTLAESVATYARTQPNKIGVRDSRRILSYAEWDQRATRLGNALLKLGLAKGGRVALLAFNTSEWLEIYVALARTGLVAVPINFRLAAPEIAYVVQNSEARAFIVQNSLREVVDSIRMELPISTRCYISFGTETTPSSWTGYESILAMASTEMPAIPVRPNDLFALMYTSGTTGRPKGAMRSHEGNALIAWATAVEFGLTREDNGLLVMPLCHANSLYFSVTFAMLGATIIIEDHAHFNPEALLGLLAREQITFTSLVPAHYIMMQDLPTEVKMRYDLSRVEKLLVSSSPARQETKRAIFELFPNGRLFELYGSTEAGWVTVLRPEEQMTKLGSVGREWCGSGNIQLLDKEGQEVPDGEVGELYSRTGYVFGGYWKDPQKTTEAFWYPPGLKPAESYPQEDAENFKQPLVFHGAWCSVGDMARRDEEGFIYLVDRKSNMIISGGENIYPSEVEAILAVHPSVRDVAVVGIPNAKWGEQVQAFIVLRHGHHPSENELIDWCRGRIAGYKRPRRILFIEEHEMPRTATGKIQHRLLRERITNQA